jgi:hypothetical protein
MEKDCGNGGKNLFAFSASFKVASRAKLVAWH